jgi:hypothetical protein
MEKKIIVFGSGKIRKEGIGNKRQAYSQKNLNTTTSARIMLPNTSYRRRGANASV